MPSRHSPAVALPSPLRAEAAQSSQAPPPAPTFQSAPLVPASPLEGGALRPTAHPLDAGLRAGLGALGLSLSEGQVGQLLAYVDWLAKWNKVYNLTALRDPADMLTHHLLDSLAAIAPLRRQLAGLLGADSAQSPARRPDGQPWRLLDVGSGGGLPGVVIAIACPDVAVWCVDTVAKKALFIEQVAAALRLPNLHGIHARVEQLTGSYDVVCSRAFASLPDFVQWSRRALRPSAGGVDGLDSGGVWMAMKGRHPVDELAALPKDVDVFHVEQLDVPGLDAERCIVWMRPRQAGTP
jgi:16S rRNA (guanine527-N7)-methyltransferase